MSRSLVFAHLTLLRGQSRLGAGGVGVPRVINEMLNEQFNVRIDTRKLPWMQLVLGYAPISVP